MGFTPSPKDSAGHSGQPMTYSEKGDQVVLEMSREDFQRLVLLTGFAAGVASREGDKKTFWGWIDFANRLNATNPRYTPYEIPEEFRPRE